MEDTALMQKFDVSREVISKLHLYHALLLKWQKAVNIVSPKTLDEAWGRHFVDSLQIMPLIPAHVKVIADLGSGGGFPGLVVACLRDDINVHSVESDMKKCQFQKAVSRETILENFTVHNMRIEQAYEAVLPDMVTARALASLDKLFGYVYPWVEVKPDIELLFLKGLRAEEEIAQAREFYDFSCDIYPSVTEPDAAILHVRDLKQR